MIFSCFVGWYVGKALALALGKKGVFVTVVDFSERGKEVADLIEKDNAKFHTGLKFPSAMFIKCDVTNTGKYEMKYFSISSYFHLNWQIT